MELPGPFGRYLLLERIASGGMAEVHKAKAFGVEGFERIVAIKQILPRVAEDHTFVRMFIDEARIAALLTHQNIVQIHELGTHEGTYFIAMEHVSGRDLRQLLDLFKKNRRVVDEPMACFVVARLCDALDYAHHKRDARGKSLGLIHRDVTPQNVLVSYEGEVKLCDFGIAKAAVQSAQTQAGIVKGKFAYMSPEQIRGRKVDHRSDLFSLGVLFYELLTGQRLFIAETDHATLKAVVEAEVPPPSSVKPGLAPILDSITLKLLQKEPAARYSSASELLDDLHRYFGSTGKLFHSHQLRTFMQRTFAKEIAEENVKLASYEELRQPGAPAEPGPAEVPPPDPAEAESGDDLDDPYAEKTPFDPGIAFDEAGQPVIVPEELSAQVAPDPGEAPRLSPLPGSKAFVTIPPLVRAEAVSTMPPKELTFESDESETPARTVADEYGHFTFEKNAVPRVGTVESDPPPAVTNVPELVVAKDSEPPAATVIGFGEVSENSSSEPPRPQAASSPRAPTVRRPQSQLVAPRIVAGSPPVEPARIVASQTEIVRDRAARPRAPSLSRPVVEVTRPGLITPSSSEPPALLLGEPLAILPASESAPAGKASPWKEVIVACVLVLAMLGAVVAVLGHRDRVTLSVDGAASQPAQKTPAGAKSGSPEP
ncbi:MAG: protein kinase [Deltaproteobacteria bacterium]|nr:protein kinase [Deltaproteobacteria bacterium]